METETAPQDATPPTMTVAAPKMTAVTWLAALLLKPRSCPTLGRAVCHKCFIDCVAEDDFEPAQVFVQGAGDATVPVV